MHKKRLLSVYFLFLTAMLLLTIRFYTIATSGSSAMQVLSGQYSRKIDIAQRRGFVFDRRGEKTDMKNCGFSVFVNPEKIPENEYLQYADILSSATGKESSYFFERMFLSVPFVTVSKSFVEGKGISCYELFSVAEGDFMCHISGYCNSDGKGTSGIRYAYDDFLQNENVKTVFARYKADAKGVGIKNSDTEIFDDGYNENPGVYLSIDGDIQRLTEEILKEKMETGAVVVQDINTAEILSCVSMPTYNISDVAAYLDSDKGELLNRAFLGYTPGSVFKTIVSASALEKDISLVDREYECRGYIEVSGNIISCHKKEGHGKIKMREAFSVSCNPYFISLVLETGVADVIETAKKMGVSKLSDLDGLPLSKGVLPEGELCGTDVANTAVGQGKLLLNPIEMNSVMICAATGYYKEPTLVSKLVFEDGREEISERKKEKVLSEYTVATLRSMLFSCVNSGTGYRAKNENILCAGKTATAQSGQIKNGKEVIHSWFSGYFPADEPKYVITVLCDGNGENNYHPTLIFKEIAEKIAKKEES